MFNILTNRIVFELCLMEQKRRRKMNKSEIFMFGFLDFAIGQRSF